MRVGAQREQGGRIGKERRPLDLPRGLQRRAAPRSLLHVARRILHTFGICFCVFLFKRFLGDVHRVTFKVSSHLGIKLIPS